MSRAFNFCAGPATLPEAVLKQAQSEMLDWRGTGMSVMEMSHRSDEFVAIAEAAEKDLRELAGISDDYAVLFMQGGASSQFSTIPLNLLGDKASADYVNTGNWSKKAAGEAERFLNVNVAADGVDRNYVTIPDPATWQVTDEAKYLHLAVNETVVGVEFHQVPEVSDAPLAADMSSTLLSRPVDINRFGLIYAGAQKNIGPAGITVVIVREDLLDRARLETPSVTNYRVMADADSMFNTPPTFAWYVAGLVFQWIKQEGGLAAMGERNQEKARKLYAGIDASGFYSNPVDHRCRSWMNVPFTLVDPKLDTEFLQKSAEAGLANLKGHRLVGGMRASIYNAMPEAGVDALLAFMADFETRHG